MIKFINQWLTVWSVDIKSDYFVSSYSDSIVLTFILFVLFSGRLVVEHYSFGLTDWVFVKKCTYLPLIKPNSKKNFNILYLTYIWDFKFFLIEFSSLLVYIVIFCHIQQLFVLHSNKDKIEAIISGVLFFLIVMFSWFSLIIAFWTELKCLSDFPYLVNYTNSQWFR